MTRVESVKFAQDWADAWNERDVERVLAWFVDDVVFVSPTAQALVGKPTVRGKPALRAYWNQALGAIASLRFTVERVLWDDITRSLAIIYVADINAQKKRVSENLVFGIDGRIASAEVFHGVAG